MVEFFQTLYKYSEGLIEIRPLPSGRSRFFALDDLAALEAHVKGLGRQNVYFGVGTRDGRGGGKANIINIPAAYLDIDFKDTPQPDADAVLATCPVKPTAIVNSGNGYHVYWLLKEPVEATPNELLRLERLLASMAVALKADTKATDAARILRVPGTDNVKRFPPAPCVVVYLNGAECTLEDLESAFPVPDDLAPAGCRKPLSEGPVASGERNADLTRWVGKWFTDGHDLDTVALLAAGRNAKFHVPPLPAREVDQIVASVQRAHLRNHPEEMVEIKGADRLTRVTGVARVTRVTGGAKGGFSVTTSHNESQPESQLESQLEAKTGPLSGAALVRAWVGEATGRFTISDIYRDLTLVTRQEKSLCRKTLERLKNEGVIESLPQSGSYHVISLECSRIVLDNIDVKTFPIRLPFGLNKMVRVMPKNMIVVAGESNAGKTALMLAMAWQNIHHFDSLYGKDSVTRPRISYFSSEMGPVELVDRLNGFGHPLPIWQRGCEFYERGEDFHNVLDPDGINFIDYLEVFDNFYEIGGKLKRIDAALRNGIAVIGLQKNQGVQLGLGGAHSIHKSRLYLTLESHAPYFNLLSVVKAKSWASATNPNGMSIPFLLSGGGVAFRSVGDWARREPKDVDALKKAMAQKLDHYEANDAIEAETPEATQ